MENENAKASEATMQSLPQTPDLMAPLSRELESVIAKRNLLTCRTRKKVLEDLRGAAEEEEVIYLSIDLILSFTIHFIMLNPCFCLYDNKILLFIG